MQALLDQRSRDSFATQMSGKFAAVIQDLLISPVAQEKAHFCAVIGKDSCRRVGDDVNQAGLIEDVFFQARLKAPSNWLQKMWQSS